MKQKDESTSQTGTLAVIYVVLFVITWQESFPGLALQHLMTYKLSMSLPAISANGALIYMPFNWKPIYSWLSDNFALCGYHRIPYFFLGALIAIIGYLATAGARSPGVLLLFCVLSSIGTSTMNLMADSLIVDAVGCRKLEASAVQGLGQCKQMARHRRCPDLCLLHIYEELRQKWKDSPQSSTAGWPLLSLPLLLECWPSLHQCYLRAGAILNPIARKDSVTEGHACLPSQF